MLILMLRWMRRWLRGIDLSEVSGVWWVGGIVTDYDYDYGFLMLLVWYGEHWLYCWITIDVLSIDG
jgi:hypothetical protein